jgi:hypothetical protein
MGVFHPRAFLGRVFSKFLYLPDLMVTDRSEVRALGKVLPDQSIRTFIRASLPGAVRISKIDFHLRLFREKLVLSHFSASIISH